MAKSAHYGSRSRDLWKNIEVNWLEHRLQKSQNTQKKLDSRSAHKTDILPTELNERARYRSRTDAHSIKSTAL